MRINIDQTEYPKNEIKAIVELHIEQGPVLEQTGDVIGCDPALSDRP